MRAGFQKITQQYAAVEGGAVCVGELRVPLRSGDIAFAGRMAVDGLRNVIGYAPSLDLKTRGDVFDALVVNAVDPGHIGVGEEFRQAGAFDDVNIVLMAILGVRVAVYLCSGHLGEDVLVERATERHIDEL